MFAKFENNKSTVVTMELAEGENPSDWVKVDDSLAGHRLIKDGKKVRAMTDEEAEAERAEAYEKYLAAQAEAEAK